MITHERAKKNLFDNDEIDLDLHYKYIKQQEVKDKEHEELVRDVKRFMEIANDCVVIDGCIREYIDLRRKLLKVGTKDV